MNTSSRRMALPILILICVLIGVHLPQDVWACGGLFCQNIPVDQQAERIIFTVNGDGTVSAYVQINYTGSAPEFSWVVPVPNTPDVDVAEIATFDALSNLTAPVFITPPFGSCVPVVETTASGQAAGGEGQQGQAGVTVLASGTAGPYAYDVVTSPDPNVLITWLRTNQYTITEEMEPLVRVYTDEGLVFLAMKLQPDQGVQDIQPIKMTYRSQHPMIPLRLTAVAANPNMTVITWIFADEQAYSTNYAAPTVEDTHIRGVPYASPNNYLQLVDQTVDLYQGRAFVTEYAQPTIELMDFAPTDPLLLELIDQYDYVTRFLGRISPEEMTVDPTFDFDNKLPDISNVHDLSQVDPEIYWGCNSVPVEIKFDPDVVPEDFR
ncbi:MAG: DUF2330 domain-containing protein [Anaerolineae bacterium]|nr:DUF2330 domain-containing protein [Anaerolineae bacterium]